MAAKNIIAGNWKMNLNFNEGESLADSVFKASEDSSCDIILAPPFIHLQRLAMMAEHYSQVSIAAQNCHEKDKGAYTGEVSPSMLASIHVKYVILGHSERREYQLENNALLKAKVANALSAGLKVIFCCGEPLEVRKMNGHQAYVANQLEESLLFLTAEQISNVVIAYEPIWAIGTGETATPDQVQEMHSHLRQCLTKVYGIQQASQISLLYGGSVKPDNAVEIFKCKDVNGALVGGASLNVQDFMAIVNSI
jgi:triosephosphate isomerase (TIM)